MCHVKKSWAVMGKRLTNIKAFINKHVSPVFLLLLILSTIMWYLTKLSHTYTAQVPIAVNIEGNRFSVACLVEGTGHRIVAHRFFMRNVVNLNFRDVQATPSMFNSGSYVINAYSLQNAISVNISDLKIISVGDLPEIRIPYDG